MNEEQRKHIKLIKERLEMGDNINLNMFNYKNNYYNYINGMCLASSSDDISNILQQFLLHSSSSSEMAHFGGPTDNPPAPPGGGGWDLVGAHGENDTDEYDCESEFEICQKQEGFEALVDEAPAKPAPPRSSSKRSRAAEVHNLSEKRRRSRINEKMKALQNLIPNSNKTDKASMLDEAIEYLKQLQLQVQMLSMRNGLSLHPLCLPGVLQPLQFSQTRMNLGDKSGSLSMNVSSTVPENQETSVQMIFDLPNQCNSSNPVSMPNMSNIITSETSFELKSIQAQLGPFQLLSSSQDFCREDIVHHQQLKTNTSEFGLAATTTDLLPFDTHESGLEESSNLDASMMRRDKSNGVLLKNIDHDFILSPHLTRKQAGRSDTKLM